MITPNKPSILFTLFLQLVFFATGNCQILHVGAGYPFETLPEALNTAVAGDTVLVHQGTYNGGIYVEDLQGTSTNWIYILAATGESVIFEGGANAWQFSDAAFLFISGFIFQHQTGNGLNFDDGGTYATPAHHVIFDHCTFRDMNANGNDDLLKLSGLDDFEIRSCTFLNGAEGGSGIDMVGCHDGLIKNCHFENQGSNSIQAKGGARNIRIEANWFKNGGNRTLNLGGSTDLPFFRPIDAPYEASDLKVYSNIFIGSEAPVAFVGCINSEVVNNTIFLPEKWVMRILQETVDMTRFPPCSYNTFRNNIIYIDDHVSVECNIGPDTAPETFTFSNNMWYNSSDPGWSGPELPVVDENNKIGEDPLFVNAVEENFSLMEESHAKGGALIVDEPQFDYIGVSFAGPRSIGAFQGSINTGVEETKNESNDWINVYPNPNKGLVNIKFQFELKNKTTFFANTLDGKQIAKGFIPIGAKSFSFPLGDRKIDLCIISFLANDLKKSCLIMLN